MGFIAYATLSPLYLRPTLTAAESTGIVLLEQVGAFALLGLLFSWSYPGKAIFVGSIVFGSAVILELLQIAIPDRHARMIDALEKLTGGASGMLLAEWLSNIVLPVKVQGALLSWMKKVSLDDESAEIVIGFSAILLLGITLVFLQRP